MVNEAHPGIDDLLPEDAQPIASVRGVIYLDPEGAEHFAWQSGRLSSLATTCGLVSIIAHTLMTEGMAPAESAGHGG